jgi:hypothetical protein
MRPLLAFGTLLIAGALAWWYLGAGDRREEEPATSNGTGNLVHAGVGVDATAQPLRPGRIDQGVAGTPARLSPPKVLRHLDLASFPDAEFHRGDPWELEIWHAPLDLVLPDLVAWAEAGDPAAMEALGSRLGRCTEAGRRRAQRNYEVMLGHIEAGQRIAREQGRAPRLPDARAFHVSSHAAELRGCAAASPELLADPLRWIERAGELGHAPARLRYLREAFEDFDGPRAALAGLDVVIERQGIARRFLEAELAAGNRAALQFVGSGWNGPEKRLGLAGWERLAYQQVWLDFSRRDGGHPRYLGNLEESLSTTRSALSIAERERADAAAAEFAGRWSAAVARRSTPAQDGPR